MLKTVLTGGLLSASLVLVVQNDAAADRGGDNGTNCNIAVGPDVIVGDLRGLSNYDSVGGIEAFAIGTESCNIGDEELLWYSGTNQKPVIGQSLYRLKDGRFEQLGQGWLKHGFYALSDNWCDCGCDPTDGTVLGVGCSDLYSSGLNGQQSNMGPKYEVNAFTGYYPYPATDLNQTGDGIYKRVQIAISELDPNQNGGGIYIVEGQYICPDDNAQVNGLNNSSWVVADVSGSGNSWNMNIDSNVTQRESMAIDAWAAFSGATVTSTFVENEGLVKVGCLVTDLGGGLYEYEYAVQNFNSHRSISSFAVPISAGAQVSNIDFHDVAYHSGSPVDGTDWTGGLSNGYVVWECTETYQENEWANAISWGTAYNFRFRTNVVPQDGTATLGVFRPAIDDSVAMETFGDTIVPGGDVEFVDCNDNGIGDDEDISDGTSSDCNVNGIPDECESFEDCPPELEIELLGGAPSLLNPDGDSVGVQITELVPGTFDPNGLTLVYDAGAGEVSSALVPDGSAYSANFPGLPCFADVSWYIQAVSLGGDEYRLPENAPLETYDSVVAIGVTAFEDNGEVDLGWAVSGSATDGQWTVATTPAGGGERGDPPADSDGSGKCHLTDNVAGNSDVDGGSTILTSPVLDASIDSPKLSYARWFHNSFGASPFEDTMEVEISDDAGASWILLEQIGPDGPEVSGDWFVKEFALDDVAGFTANDQFRIRFTANDTGNGSVVEAGVDAILISTIECDEVECPADIDGSGQVDVGDLLAVIAAWGSADAESDLDGSGLVDVGDLLAVIAAWSSC
ncbi:MAG: hypothetical protein P8L37_06120 [Phycisphaerales bacterium]|nr:hypothetical protein [Phycisphaerales bacterium]